MYNQPAVTKSTQPAVIVIIIIKWHCGRTGRSLSLPRGDGRPRLSEPRVAPLASGHNPLANPIRVMTKYHDK